MIRYILTALGLYLIAKENYLPGAWLAWIPELNCTVLGTISDDYQGSVEGKVCRKRFWLPLLFIVMCITMIFALLVSSGADAPPVMLLWIIPAIACAVGYVVMHAFALYDLYRICVPNQAILFLVLSLCIGIAEPVLILLAAAKYRRWIKL